MFKIINRHHHCNLPYPEFYFDREWQCWRCKMIWFKKIDRAGNEYFVKRR